MPEIRPAACNYAVAIYERWRGRRYSFVTRYRSGFADTAGDEFDAAFTRLDHLEECADDIRLDVMWHRHTGQWWPLHRALALEDALPRIETDALLLPHP